MKSLWNKVRTAAITIAAFAFSSLPALALDLIEARDLLLSGNTSRLASEFDRHQTSFDAAQIGRDDYMEPYYAFATTHPAMAATIQDWLETAPDSIQARSADGILLVHRANLLHGPQQPGHEPGVLRDKIAAVAEPASDALRSVLETRPDHLPSAYALDLLGAISGGPELRSYAHDLLMEHDDPLPVLLADLRFADFANWPADAHKFCRERTKQITDFTSGNCMTFAKFEHGRYATRGVGGLHSTLPSPPERLIAELEGGSMTVRKPAAAFEIIAGSRNASALQAMNLAYRLGPDRVLEAIVQPRLKYDPLNPQWLSVLGQIQYQKGRPSLAWQTIESSLELGAHDPFVRLARIKFMDANTDMRWNTTDELLDAFAATEGSMAIVTTFLNRIMSPPETMIYRGDGSVNPIFECVQLLFVERFIDWCEQNTDSSGKQPSHKCSGNSAVQMNALADRVRGGRTCGPDDGWRKRTTWLMENRS